MSTHGHCVDPGVLSPLGKRWFLAVETINNPYWGTQDPEVTPRLPGLRQRRPIIVSIVVGLFFCSHQDQLDDAVILMPHLYQGDDSCQIGIHPTPGTPAVVRRLLRETVSYAGTSLSDVHVRVIA
jgi:hypothetical protein